MTDTFTKIAAEFEGDGDGLAAEVRDAALAKRDVMVTKLITGGCKTMEQYADAVGVIRGLDHILNYAAEARRKAQVQLADENKED